MEVSLQKYLTIGVLHLIFAAFPSLKTPPDPTSGAIKPDPTHTGCVARLKATPSSRKTPGGGGPAPLLRHSLGVVRNRGSRPRGLIG